MIALFAACSWALYDRRWLRGSMYSSRSLLYSLLLPTWALFHTLSQLRTPCIIGGFHGPVLGSHRRRCGAAGEGAKKRLQVRGVGETGGCRRYARSTAKAFPLSPRRRRPLVVVVGDAHSFVLKKNRAAGGVAGGVAGICKRGSGMPAGQPASPRGRHIHRI